MAASYVDGTVFHHFEPAHYICGVQERVLVSTYMYRSACGGCGLIVWISVVLALLVGWGWLLELQGPFVCRTEDDPTLDPRVVWLWLVGLRFGSPKAFARRQGG